MNPHRLEENLSYLWRLVATNVGFSVFGIGSIVISTTIFPLVYGYAWITNRGAKWARSNCQYVVHLGFRLFLWFISAIGVLTFEVEGQEKLDNASGRVIVANHPTLLDVVFLISMIPHAFCVVKKALWSNFFLSGVLRGVGYIPNGEPFQLIDDCVEALKDGQNLVIFPEATRTVRGRDIKMKRGAASVISKTACPTIPVSITCTQPMLSKSEKWFLPSPKKPHFRIVVHDTYDPSEDIAETDRLSLSSRRINERLKTTFVAGLVKHG